MPRYTKDRFMGVRGRIHGNLVVYDITRPLSKAIMAFDIKEGPIMRMLRESMGAPES